MDDNVYIMISMYKQHPILCDLSDVEYKNKGHRQNVEVEIVAALEKPSTYIGRLIHL